MNSFSSEIEVRFLNIDKPRLIQKLIALGADDHGEKLLQEVIFSDQALVWQKEGKVVRVRQ